MGEAARDEKVVWHDQRKYSRAFFHCRIDKTKALLSYDQHIPLVWGWMKRRIGISKSTVISELKKTPEEVNPFFSIRNESIRTKETRCKKITQHSSQGKKRDEC
jgi:hypothetical protein